MGPRKIRDVINSAYHVIRPDAPVLRIDQEYWNIRDNVVEGETIIARTLGYELNSPPTALFLLNYCRALNLHKDAVQTAWEVLLESHSCRVCVTVLPHAVAAASIYVALLLLQSPLAVPSEEAAWWTRFGVTTPDILSLAGEIMRALETRPPAAELLRILRTPPNLDAPPV